MPFKYNVYKVDTCALYLQVAQQFVGILLHWHVRQECAGPPGSSVNDKQTLHLASTAGVFDLKDVLRIKNEMLQEAINKRVQINSN